MILLKEFSRDIGKLLEITHNTYDVIIRVGEGTSQKDFKAHSLILSIRSSYFQKELKNIEKLFKEDGIIVFEKQNYSSKSFKIILKYLYTGKIELRDLDTFDILQVLIISNELELSSLIQFLLQFLIENQSEHLYRNPLKFLHILLNNNHNEIFSNLRDHCIDIICENPLKFLFNSNEFLLLDKSILSLILNQDFLDVKEEIQIWNYILKWGIAQMPSSQLILKTINNWSQEEINTLKEILYDFIPLIRWLDIPLNDIMNKVAPYSNILPKGFCREIFNFHHNINSFELNIKDNSLINYIKSLPPRFPLNSLFLTPKKVTYISSWIDKMKKNYYLYDINSQNLPYKFKLLYRASRDGFDAKRFHTLCDNKGPTITIAKISKKNLLIGGYNPLDWKQKSDSINGNSMYQTENSFLFCFGKGEKKGNSDKEFDEKPIVKSRISKLIRVTNPQKAIYYNLTSGPCFGGGCDLGIINNKIFSYGSLSYNGINKFIKEGSHLDLDDYEVFQVVK
ncbi:hypothetical protein C1645_741087 [Glomus cerebriforme]|uniref:BTB/POZ domain-containing protein n=1 Tax=Glomus cerebriforme TaxID=658196 RepID=A0A397STC9_9GLOM|nr:hypothetical protein C1645_741087 [Glomus cerebriforme]